MGAFHDLLLSRFELGGFSTEDALAAWLPLARQVAQAHAVGKVAPLDGVEALRVEGAQLWFPESEARLPSRNASRVNQLDRPVGGVEILSEEKRTLEVDSGAGQSANLLIGARDQELVRPVYLPGYVSWEQQIGHHDPLSDVFCLGLILASLSCRLDLNDPEDLDAFVRNRRNLFQLNPQLHPVLGKAVSKMTELSRHRRPQDLPTLIHNLQHYRDQNVDFDFDLASADGAAAAGTRRPVILSKLRDRLFELSRRNRLLHFRPTMSAVNLTQASVPLSFDVESIRPEQVLTWSGEFARIVSAAEPVCLNRYLNFAEQLHLPSLLDRIRTDAVRDAAEFGFEQLRLAICFLRWSNVKETPPEPFDSPLALLPVRLVKKKGVRDSYWLQPLTDEAELNPIVRHLFKSLYDIDLPATIDLSETTLDQLYEDLARKVTASEPGVTFVKVDRPRIDLIHDMARRRLDRYRRSARLSGRGIRSFLDVDYSYDPANFHPLGLAIFRAKVRPAPTHLREIVQDEPEPRHYMVESAEAPVQEKEKRFYALREEADGNPYNWEFDLCRLTLGNFKYRKMTLVRDYAELLGDDAANPAFDAVFSLSPRAVDLDVPKALPLEDRFQIVACDPTQASAISLARTGATYIIQGPPGTGKSQTITNLIADYVMQGKRVLFVCAKRAAIDVVFARLRRQGLHSLCCLIHDSQTDKKEFILDLKATYESLLGEQKTRPRAWQKRRANLIALLRQELEPLEQFNQAMLSAPASAGTRVRQLLERAIELQDAAPELSPAERESLPDYAEWLANTETVARLVAAVRDIQADGVLAHHPLRLLDAEVARDERPRQRVEANLRTAQAALGALTAALTTATGDPPRTLADVQALIDYADAVDFLAKRKRMSLLDDEAPATRSFASGLKQYAAARSAANQAGEATRNWTHKLPAGEVGTALEQALALQGRLLSLFNPAWWRLRKVMRSSYRFEAHAVRPSWSRVLSSLDEEYKAQAAVAAVERAVCEDLGLDAPLETVVRHVQGARRTVQQMPEAVKWLHRMMMQADRPAEIGEPILQARQIVEDLQKAAAAFLDNASQRRLDDLRRDLETVDRSLDMLSDFLYCLGQLAQLPGSLARAFRTLPLDARQMEAAIVSRNVDDLFRGDRVLNRFNGQVRDAHARRLEILCRKWQDVNAAAVIERARQRFLENIRISSLPAAELAAEQKEFKASYNRGRRELEHEFGKVMRHKSIRDLVAGDSGLVVRDLKPVWLMSPLSVSDTLPLLTDAFDVVVFDEASQITLEEAVPSIFRARQAIVVGDEMQLPPTDFFSARTDGEDEEGLRLSEAGQVFEYDLSSNSFLNHAAKNLPSRMLGWHYRSRSESLISFSNWAFYQGRLLTVPEERLAAVRRDEIVCDRPADGAANVERLLDRPVSFHRVRNAVYDNRRNRGEAEYIAQLVRGLLAREERLSIGIVAFSEAQQDEITSALSRLADDDKVFADRLEEEYEREVDGQYVGLLVKNLENIQGDERDAMILSVCYGHAPDGKMRMNFGPINQSGGEKRLNVAFSRAKHHMAVVSSILHTDITNDYNDGANCLRNYLHYASACSAGDVAASQRVLRELAVWRDVEREEEAPRSTVVEQISAALTERGYAVDLGVGMSHFRCDVAARRHGELEYRLGVLVDTDGYYRQDDLLEREMMRPQLLRAFGWNIAHVLSRDWRQDRHGVLERLARIIEEGEEAPPAEEPAENEGEDPWAEFDGPEEPEEAAEPASAPEPGIAPMGGEAIQESASMPASAQDGPFRRYFEFIGGNSCKFWEVALAGQSVTVRFGRIGAKGQTQTKLFADGAVATRTARRLIREKLGKGYAEKPLPAADV